MALLQRSSSKATRAYARGAWRPFRPWPSAVWLLAVAASFSYIICSRKAFQSPKRLTINVATHSPASLHIHELRINRNARGIYERFFFLFSTIINLKALRRPPSNINSSEGWKMFQKKTSHFCQSFAVVKFESRLKPFTRKLEICFLKEFKIFLK